MCDKNNEDKRTLSKNKIKSFILRIDLIKKNGLEISSIAEKMSEYFERTEKRSIENFTINFTKGSSELLKRNAFDYVLISETKYVSMTFSEIQNAFWLECTHYHNNKVYEEITNKLIEVIKSFSTETEAKRIGMRYINEFNCEKINNIGQIFNKRISLILRSILKESYQIRAIGMEEYNNDGYKLRLQYGVPNKFYPSVLTVYDLLLDIDSYIESLCVIDDWGDNIKKLNHLAYDIFIKEMNPKFLKELK